MSVPPTPPLAAAKVAALNSEAAYWDSQASLAQESGDQWDYVGCKVKATIARRNARRLQGGGE